MLLYVCYLGPVQCYQSLKKRFRWFLPPPPSKQETIVMPVLKSAVLALQSLMIIMVKLLCRSSSCLLLFLLLVKLACKLRVTAAGANWALVRKGPCLAAVERSFVGLLRWSRRAQKTGGPGERAGGKTRENEEGAAVLLNWSVGGLSPWPAEAQSYLGGPREILGSICNPR